MSLKVGTDTTADLSQDLYVENDIFVVPIRCGFSDGQYFSTQDDLAPFYEKLASDKDIPKTFAANVNDFTEVFRPMLEAGHDVLYFGLASGLSGTFGFSKVAAAELSEEFPERKIICLDSGCVTGGLGHFLVLPAAKMCQEGKSIEEIVEFVKTRRKEVEHLFTASDLKHFHKGGRITKGEAVIGGILGLIPVMDFPYHEDEDNPGKLAKQKNVRGGDDAALKEIAKQVEADIVDRDGLIVISYADCPEKAEKQKEFILKRLPDATVIFDRIGPVIGTHAGGTTVAVFFISKHR